MATKSDNPAVYRSVFNSPAGTIFFSKNRKMSRPPTKPAGIQTIMERKGSIFQAVWAQNAPYIPSITMSPWAILMMRITPKTIVRPTPIMAYREPVSKPLTMLCTKVSMR